MNEIDDYFVFTTNVLELLELKVLKDTTLTVILFLFSECIIAYYNLSIYDLRCRISNILIELTMKHLALFPKPRHSAELLIESKVDERSTYTNYQKRSKFYICRYYLFTFISDMC